MSLVLEVSDHGPAPWAERFGTVPTRTGSTCSSTVPTKNRLNQYSARSTHKQIEIVRVINWWRVKLENNKTLDHRFASFLSFTVPLDHVTVTGEN